MKRAKPNARYNSSIRSGDNAVSIMTTLPARRRRLAIGFPAKVRAFCFCSKASIRALGPSQWHMQRITKDLSLR